MGRGARAHSRGKRVRDCARWCRSAAYLSNGDAERALADANECVALKAQWSKGYGRQGAALHALRRFDEAIVAYKKGLEVEPGSAALQDGLDEVMAARRASAGGGGGGGGSVFPPEMLSRIMSNPKFASYFSVRVAPPRSVCICARACVSVCLSVSLSLSVSVSVKYVAVPRRTRHSWRSSSC